MKDKVERVLKKVSLKNQPSDLDFWKNQPEQKRLEALETMRNQYIIWKYGSQQRFLRVYKIIERS